MKVQKLNKRQAYWVLYLSRFDFTLKKDNKNQKPIKKEYICYLVEITIEESEIYMIEKIKITREKDEEVVRVVNEMKKAILWLKFLSKDKRWLLY